MGKGMGRMPAPAVIFMARTMNRLSAVKVAGLKKPGYYADGGNLYLRIAPGGSKGWIFRFTLGGKTRDAGLGSFPAVNLVIAREHAAKFRRQVAAGMDPIETRKAEQTAQRREAAQATTFEQCAQAYIASHEASWKNEKHRAQWRSTLATYVYPIIGGLPVKAIDTALVMRILEPIWSAKPETASRVRGRIEVVLSWAKVRGFRDGENPAQWRGHIDQLLPAKGKVRKVVHHAALAYPQIPIFMEQIRQQNSLTARALEFLILTASRTNETLEATWDEIDFERGIWLIPSARMKAGKDHRVPLPLRAQEIVSEMYEIRQSTYVFPGNKMGRPFSQMALAMLLRRMGHGTVTVHGFRSTFRDWANECTTFPGTAAEMALAHTVSNAVEAAYRRGDMLEKRKQMMAAWADYCAKATGCDDRI
jgi:integrase